MPIYVVKITLTGEFIVNVEAADADTAEQAAVRYLDEDLGSHDYDCSTTEGTDPCGGPMIYADDYPPDED